MYSKKVLMLSTALIAVSMAAANIFGSPAREINLPDPEVNNIIQDDTVPDVTARVARISYIKGDVQIRRVDSEEWEHAALNLPIVEGDEISTGDNARLEIQFNSYTHLRLDENSYLRVAKLIDEGIAVSIPQGSMSVHLNQFDKDRAYFEIDAPGSTIAAQRSGSYRIDTGEPSSSEIRVSVTDEGEARIYSESTGFLLKSGRTARVYVGGNNAGEWEIRDAAMIADNFDSWVLERDDTIAKSLQNAYYDKYYDRDIYGAEDLSGYGDWVYSRNYGYVWRPYSSALSGYANWSPYRYGHWRWIPPYGWTWINDEPWGWATYHHGRWFYDAGYWYWSPYGAYRSARSWWSPALVVITTFASNICWYPLPYDYGYYNYNWWYYSQPGWGGGHWGGGGHQGGGGGHQGGGGGGATPTPTPPVVAGGPLSRPKGPKTPPLGTVPPTGVITVPTEDFGRLTKGTRTPPLGVATSVLSKIPTERTTTPSMPEYKNLKGRVSRDIVTERPQIPIANETVKTGAATRKTDAPLDRELQTTRVLGGRPPLQTVGTPEVKPGNTHRQTGGVDRPPVERKPVEQQQPETKPRYDPPVTKQPPVYVPPPETKPRYDPPVTKQPPVYTPPPETKPRYEPPVTRQPPRQEPPRYEPPPTKQPPPSESKPKKPDPPADTPTKKKDGR